MLNSSNANTQLASVVDCAGGDEEAIAERRR